MTSAAHCSACGRKLPVDSRAAVCPACEFAGALETSQGEPFEPVSGSVGATRFGDYELLEEIAQGGMGVVYRGRQMSLNRIVAIKMILAGEHASSQFVQRFRTEATAAARLQHPNIIAIHEVGEQEGRHFFSMEYVEGPNLQDLVRNKPLAPKRAASYAQTLAEAIHYAHQQGILHRDLKPSNVLINSADQPKITDFGLAKVLTSDTDLTLSGQLLGTPHYLPPEQASGKRDQIGPWSDVYGLGAILYYLLTGRPPFQAQELTEVLDQVLHREPISPRLLNASVPRDLETICLKCLEKEAPRRYPSAKALADDLGRHLRQETIVARPVGAPEKAWRWCRRKPALAAALAVCGLTLLLGFTGVAWQWRRAEGEGQAARRSQYASDMLLAQQAFAEDNYGRVEQLLRRHDPLWSGRPGEDLRGWEWSFLRGQIKSDESFTLGLHSNTVSFLTFSADGYWLASASHYEFGNNVKVWDLRARRCVATLWLERARKLDIIAFSPDSQRLLVADASRLTVYQPPEWREPAPGLTLSNRFQAITYTQDGQRLVGLEGDSPFRIRVMDARHFDTIGSWPAIDGRALAVSPDARYAAVQSRQTAEIIVYELATGARVVVLPGPGRQYRQGNLRFSPDGRLLASVVHSGADEIQKRVDFWSVPQFRLVHKLPAAGTHFSSVTFSPDARFAYLASGNQSIAVYEAAKWDLIQTLHGHRDEIWCLALSPDGRWLASGSRDETIRFWSATVPPAAPTSWSLPSATREVYLAEDGQSLATVMTNEVIRVWSLPNFQGVAEWSLPFPKHIPWSNRQWTQVALAPGGAGLALGGESEADPKGRTANLIAWKLPSKGRTVEYPGLRTWPAGLAFSTDGALLAAAGTFGEGQALIWDSQTGQRFCQLTNVLGRSGLLKFSPRRTYLAVRLDEGATWGWEVGLWKLPRSERERILAKPRHRVIDMAFSPDERFLATAGEDASVCIWAVDTGQRMADLPGQLNCYTAVAWSPAGDRLLGGGEDGAITIWDTASQQPVGRLVGHGKPIRGLAFLPDGRSIVSVSLDLLRIWRALPLGSYVVLTHASAKDASSSPPLVPLPSPVAGAGLYQHFVHPSLGDVYPSDEKAGQFVININPAAQGTPSPAPAVSVRGPALEAFWGGPLVIREDFQDWIPILWDRSDPKPGQVFVYKVTHPVHGEVAVCVYAHDNVSPGHNPGDPAWSDWFGIYVEPWDGGNRHYNGEPDWRNDDLFTGMGILSEGNLMDYRK